MIWNKNGNRLEFRNPNSAGDGYDVYTYSSGSTVPDTLKLYNNGSYGMIQTNNRNLKIDASGGSLYFTTNNHVYFNANNGRYSFNRGAVAMIEIDVNDTSEVTRKLKTKKMVAALILKLDPVVELQHLCLK